jgi:2-hydroxychromene-2-carboxylate isomerase
VAAQAAQDSTRVRVDYDLASSLCYVAHRAMARLAPQLDALEIDLEWSPLDLSALLGWPRGVRVDPDRRANVKRVSTELGVPLCMPPTWQDSRRAHAIGLAQADPDRESLWRERVFSAVFEQGLQLDDDTIDALAAELRFDCDAEHVLRGQEELDERTHAAGLQRVTGVPNFMLGEWPFGGIQTDETMLSVLGRFARKQRGWRGET